MYLVDKDLNEITLLTQYSSGTKMFPIVALNQDENGQFYGLSYDYSENSPSTKVLLFNNIFTSNQLNGNYSAVLRQSYIIPNSSTSYKPGTYSQNSITKIQGESTYYIVLTNLNTNKTTIIEFVINVGSTNDWNVYDLTQAIDKAKYSILPYNNNGTMEIHIYGVDTSDNVTATYYEFMIKEGVVTQENSINISTHIYFLETQVFYKNINEIYIVLEETDNRLLCLYKINGSSLVKLWETNLVSNGNSYFGASLYLFLINDVVFCRYYKKFDNNDIRVCAGILQNDTLYLSNEVSTSNLGSIYSYVDMYVIPNYNYINVYIPVYTTSPVTTHKLTMIYNTTNYNGAEYESTNSLIPDNSILYDNNNNIIFARNLYNRTLFNSSCTSTVEVPNTLLNSVTINQSDLLSETNTILVSDTETISKNIYEKLFINFINTINVIDEDTNIKYQTTANSINSNIHSSSNTNNALMNNKKIAKITINFQDETSLTNLIQLTQIDATHYNIQLTFYVSDDIDTIDIVSSDETIKYLTIDASNLGSGKTYTLSQNLRIE